MKGSPPPTRGTWIWTLPWKPHEGITPAYAGNMAPVDSIIGAPEDHPRLRGEHLLRYLHLVYPQGSPPPTRGTSEAKQDALAALRITPAYAGNIFSPYTAPIGAEDHPRLRGEHKNT